ncbi:hypothetical protein F1654_11725 [Alkalicaulis satelles]|uniref:Uncharacterized protein n=1 Tax=Alkalicaulis satelles TaxID=2609175 RepID=A0A5M6ZH77_9PROT|nr:hypothetical protein [Alkalicaulis satelles]KAA5801561.1 hypothetical protein F1654_11725 [Alkalicaulis satelles]
MTSTQQTDPRDDLAYVRRMTERAARAPLLGGRFLVFWGGLLALAYIAHFLAASGLVASPGALGWIWVGFGAIGATGTFILSRGMARKPGQEAVGNQVEREVWFGAGIGIFLFVIGVFLATTLRGAPVLMFDLVASVALALYGAAFLATAAASGLRWMRIPAWISFAGAAAVPAFTGTQALYPALAVIVLIIAVAPGLRLMAAEPPALDDETL